MSEGTVAAPAASSDAREAPQARAVYVTVLVIATCGLVYELVAGTLASYVLGDSVTQFSTVIGTYLSALGVGSWLSSHVRRAVARRFVEVELAVALIGGASAPILFLAFGFMPEMFRVWLYGTVLLIGTLVGLEIPLVLRLLREFVEFRDLVARVLTFDYLGALAASLLFPLLLIPALGLVRTSLLFGIANGVVALWTTWLLPSLRNARDLRIKAVIVLVLLAVGFSQADRLTRLAETELFADEIVFATSSRYQRIVITRAGRHFQLFLNGALQFASSDEYRYHEALVHPAFGVRPDARSVLILGGGDGLAAREILRHPVDEIVLVDLDPEMTRLGRENPLLVDLNQRSLHDPRVTIVNDDAFTWLDDAERQFDLAIVDFPDPSNYSLGKLYTRHFYRRLARLLTPGGVVAVQSTSPLFARRAYWCILRTLEDSGFDVLPYRAAVPSFGEWGFALATLGPAPQPADLTGGLPDGLRYLDAPTVLSLFAIGPDMARLDTESNRLNDQILVRYYEEEWNRW